MLKIMSVADTPISKGQYIRNHLHLTPKETIEKAKAEGINLTAAFVYSTRSETKKKIASKASQPDEQVFQTASNDVELRAKIICYGTLAVRALLDSMERGE